MAIILTVNIIIFILVIRRLVRSANFTGRVKQSAKAERRATIERVQICILLLLGLTWTIGYLLLIRAVGQVLYSIISVFFFVELQTMTRRYMYIIMPYS